MEQQKSFYWATSQSVRIALVIEYISSIHQWANGRCWIDQSQRALCFAFVYFQTIQHVKKSSLIITFAKKVRSSYHFNFVGSFLVLYSGLLLTPNSIQKHFQFSIPTPVRLTSTPVVNSKEFQISAFAWAWGHSCKNVLLNRFSSNFYCTVRNYLFQR